MKLVQSLKSVAVISSLLWANGQVLALDTVPTEDHGTTVPHLTQFPSATPGGQESGSSLGGGIRFSLPTPPDRNEASSSLGGAVRGGECTRQATPVALMYKNQQDLYSQTTISSTPLMAFYVPTFMDDEGDFIDQAELVITDADNNEIYKERVTLPAQPGIVSFQLPAMVKLQQNTDYNWDFAVVCDTNDRGSDSYAQGQIRRLDGNTESALINNLNAIGKRFDLSEEDKLIQKMQAYVDAGVWNEALELAFDLRSSSPESWNYLLSFFGVNEQEAIDSDLLGFYWQSRWFPYETKLAIDTTYPDEEALLKDILLDR